MLEVRQVRAKLLKPNETYVKHFLKKYIYIYPFKKKLSN